MPRLGCNLEHYFEKLGYRINSKTILRLSIKILSLLECVHEAGYIFNDLKLDNIMTSLNDISCLDPHLDNKNDSSQSEKDLFADSDLHLIDFGFASKYVVSHQNAQYHID